MSAPPPMDHCFLCCCPLEVAPPASQPEINAGHVVARQFFTDGYLATIKTALMTLPVHETCNTSMKLDEEYMFHSIGCTVTSPTAAHIHDALAKQYEKERTKLFAQRKVLPEWGKVVLPDGTVAKLYDGRRIDKVLRAIARGAFAFGEGRVVREAGVTALLQEPQAKAMTDAMAGTWAAFEVPQGIPQFPGVFECLRAQASESGKGTMTAYAFLLWDQYFFLAGFEELVPGFE